MEQKTDSGDGGLYGGESTNKGLTLVDVFFVNNSKRTFRKTIVSTIASFAFVPPTFRLLLTCKELLAIEGKIFEGYRLPTVLSDTSDELGDERKMHCLLVRAPNSCWLEWETPLKVKDLELPKGARVTLVGVFGVERFSELLTNWTKVTATFDDMGLKENLLSGIYAYGFPAPSAVQQLGIVPILQGRDTFVQSRYFYETYPGKTSALCIAILQLIKTDVATGIQALVLVSNRELAYQFQKVAHQLGADLNDVKVQVCVGGGRVREDLRILREGGVHVVVGTPGRCYDMIDRGALRLDDVKLFCLDEADELLARGYEDQIYDVFKFLPEKVQVCLFSATMTLELFELSKRLMSNPIRILGKRLTEKLSLEGVKQYFIHVENEEWKLDTLCDLLERIAVPQTIVYCNTRRKVDWLTEKMSARNFTVSSIRGDMDQRERDIVMREFRSGFSRFLFTCTNLETWDRCEDYSLQKISHVINYDLPTRPEIYIHRVGHSGSFGRRGVAINFTTASDFRCLQDIEQLYHTYIEEMPMDVADLL